MEMGICVRNTKSLKKYNRFYPGLSWISWTVNTGATNTSGFLIWAVGEKLAFSSQDPILEEKGIYE